MDRSNDMDTEYPVRESNTIFREIFYQSPIGILSYDKKGRLTNANDSALKIARIPKLDDVLGINIFDNPKLASKKEELHKKGLIKFQDSLDLIQIEEQNIYNSIEPKIIEIDWTVSVTDSGYLVQIQDITENKKSETALKLKEVQFDVLTDNLQLGVALIDETGRFVVVNPAFMEIFGLDSKLDILNVNNQDWSQWNVYDEDNKLLDVDEHPVRKVALSGKPVRDQLVKLRNPDDTNFKWLLISAIPILNNDGIINMIICTYYDITERKKTEEALKSNQELFKKTFDSVSFAVSIVRVSDNQIVDINEAYLRMVEYRKEEVVGHTAKELQIFPNYDEREKIARLVHDGRQVRNQEIDVRTKSGKILGALFSVETINFNNQPHFLGSLINITDRKKAEEELKKKAALLDISYEAIFSWDLDKGIQSWNHGAEILYGYTEKEAIGHVSHDLLKTQFPIEFKKYQEILTKNKSWTGELVHTTKDGNKIIVESRQQMIQDTSGINVIIETNRDITEKKKTEESLKESELKYRNLFDNLPLTTNLMRYVLNDKGKVVDWVFEDMNQMTQELLGHNKGELKGNSLMELMGRNHISSFLPLVNEIRRTGKVATQESHLETMDMYHITTFAPLNNELFLTIDQDITERKKAENALRESEEKYRKIIELANEGIIIVDTSGMITYANAKSSEMFGYTVEELRGIDALSLVDKQDVEFGRQKVKNRDKGIQESYEIKCRKKNDELLWCLVSATPMFDNNGKHVGNLTMLTDITERKNFEDHKQKLLEKEQKLTEELQSSNEELQSTTDKLLKTYQELQKSSKLLSTIYELNPDAIVITSVTDSRIIDCNQEYLNQIGYSREEVIGRTSQELNLISEVTREAYIDETRGNKKVSNIEIRGKRKDGSFIDVIYSTRQIKVNNEPMILNIGQDITKRKIQEEELRESEERLVLAQRLGNVGVWDWNTVTNALTFTPELEQLYGLRPGTIKTYDDWRQLTHPDDIVKIEAEREQNIANHEPFDLEFRIFHKSGELRWLSAKGGAIYNDKGDVLRVLGINTDITERKTADKKIKELIEQLQQANKEYTESEERFQDLADNIPNLAWMADANGWIFWYNKQWYEYTGTTFEEMQGWGWQKVHHPDYVDSVTEEWSTKILEGEQYDNIFPLKGKNGDYRWFLTRIIPIKDKYGKVQRWFGTNTDVTERKLIEENLKNTMGELKQSNKELEQFAYITSHDLREPLRMITSFLQLLERRYKDQLDKDADEFIGFAVDGAKRLDAMTNDLLHYSKITNEKREIIPINFEDVLEHAITNLKVQIEENNAIITHDPLPTIKGDEQLKIQLFQNIIGNAIKYRSQETPKIHISSTKEKNHYLFSIKDNGIGMPPEHLERIFTIFKRLHTHEEYEGTGIGLAIAQKIVHQQGGQIWAESELGKGTTFYFTVPFN
jgi:PAS domain S-box-containing protein